MTQAWDPRYFAIAAILSTESRDPNLKCGAVILRPDGSIAATGYNDFPRVMQPRPEWYLDRDAKNSRVIHAEIDALNNLRENATGYTLYVWPLMCCDRCAVHVIARGITTVYGPPAPLDSKWLLPIKRGMEYFRQYHVNAVQIPHETINLNSVLHPLTD